jgi:hypothetical protein
MYILAITEIFGMFISLRVPPSTLMMEAVFSYEMSLIYRTTWNHTRGIIIFIITVIIAPDLQNLTFSKHAVVPTQPPIQGTSASFSEVKWQRRNID